MGAPKKGSGAGRSKAGKKKKKKASGRKTAPPLRPSVPLPPPGQVHDLTHFAAPPFRYGGKRLLTHYLRLTFKVAPPATQWR